MAFTLDLQTKVKQSKDCSKFYFFDCTTLWNAVSDPYEYDPTGVNGYDPNDIDLSISTLVITKPDLTEVTITLDVFDFSITRLEDTGTNLIQGTITAQDLGFDDTLADGIYKFTYRINSDADYTVNQFVSYIVQDCTACCCLDKKLSEISLCKDCSTDKKILELYDIYTKRDVAKILAGCGDYTGATAALQLVLDYCNIKKCSNC